jgi:hypothetical protein
MCPPGTQATTLHGSKRALLKILVLLSVTGLSILLPIKAFAGPPFAIDDPFSLPFHTGEFYLFAAGTHAIDGTMLDAVPAIEANYSLIPNTFLHLVAPLSLNKPTGESSAYGMGDVEIGFKWRFLDQSGSRPVVAVFPFVELPTGDESRGLGGGKAQVFLPVWLGKETGPWTMYGGGGYWINPGKENRNWWFTGILVQRQLTARAFLGGELFHQTADAVDGSSSTGFSAGGGVTIAGPYQALFSIGRNVQNVEANRLSFYAALYRTF